MRPTRRRTRGEAEARVAGLLTRSNRPLTAYEIAHRCADEGHAVAPTQVYRALTRLMQQGKVARIESLAAYMLLRGPFDVCLICDRCHGVLLLPDPSLAARLADRARRLGFAPTRLIVESRGLCADCAGIDTALREKDGRAAAGLRMA